MNGGMPGLEKFYLHLSEIEWGANGSDFLFRFCVSSVQIFESSKRPHSTESLSK